MSLKTKLNKNRNDKMKKSGKAHLTKWEKGLLSLQILAILLLGASVFFLLMDVNQQYGFVKTVQVLTATFAIFAVFCYAHFRE